MCMDKWMSFLAGRQHELCFVASWHDDHHKSSGASTSYSMCSHTHTPTDARWGKASDCSEQPPLMPAVRGSPLLPRLCRAAVGTSTQAASMLLLKGHTPVLAPLWRCAEDTWLLVHIHDASSAAALKISLLCSADSARAALWHLLLRHMHSCLTCTRLLLLLALLC